MFVITFSWTINNYSIHPNQSWIMVGTCHIWFLFPVPPYHGIMLLVWPTISVAFLDTGHEWTVVFYWFLVLLRTSNAQTGIAHTHVNLTLTQLLLHSVADAVDIGVVLRIKHVVALRLVGDGHQL